MCVDVVFFSRDGRRFQHLLNFLRYTYTAYILLLSLSLSLLFSLTDPIYIDIAYNNNEMSFSEYVCAQGRLSVSGQRRVQVRAGTYMYTYTHTTNHFVIHTYPLVLSLLHQTYLWISFLFLRSGKKRSFSV